jgi:hypothetical protein
LPAFGILAIQSTLDGIFAEHLHQRHVLADISQKLEIANALHPVGIVDDVHGLTRAVENRPDLPFNTGNVGGKLFRLK